MEQSFFPEEGRWYRGNIHSHTTRTDGLCPPAQQIRDYSEQGYDFLAITDHNVIDSHRLGEGLPICMIPGWERDIRHCSDNTKCIHVVGLVPSPAQETPCREARRCSCLEIPDQQLLDEMRSDGQFVVLAHPHWSGMTPSEVMSLTGFNAIEVFNTGCERLMHAGRADLYWDLLLQSGRRVWGVACDDTHGKTQKSDRFGGWVMVRTEICSPPEILAAMSAGTYYFSQGPVIHDWGIREDTVYFRCSPCPEIHVTTYPPRGSSCYAPEGEMLTEIAYPLKGGELYIRVECIDKEGHTAWTNPHFFTGVK